MKSSSFYSLLRTVVPVVLFPLVRIATIVLSNVLELADTFRPFVLLSYSYYNNYTIIMMQDDISFAITALISKHYYKVQLAS